MCGIVGITNRENASYFLVDAAEQIQHRGQDSAGAITWGYDKFHVRKGAGLVREVFTKDTVRAMKGRYGISHVRYPTHGSTNSRGDIERNSQPLYVEYPFPIAIEHNGQVTNTAELDELLRRSGKPLDTGCDIEYALRVFQLELEGRERGISNEDIFEAVGKVMDMVEGAYSVAMLMKTRKGPKLIAFSDTHKIRPLVYGRHEDSFMVASETVAFDHLGYEYIGDVKGGEAIIFDEDGMHRERVRKGIPRHCIFEWIYFSRPSSIIEGEEVYKFRWNVGWRQADDEISSGLWTPSMFDAFLGVPDSGAAYIHGCCSRLVQEALEHGKISPRDAVKLMSEQGLDKNKYVGRTFIAILGERKKMLQGKFNPIRSVVEGKRVVDWDDTSIRGNTQIHKNQALRRAGAKEVHNRFIRVEHPCFFGIDMTTKNQFIASGKDDQELAEALGADSVMSPDVERILVPSLTDIPYEHLCTGCLNGNYATDVSELLEAASRNCSGRPYENDDQSI